MKLSDAKCRSAKPGAKLHKLSDGGGLQLWVHPTGGRLWRFAYRFDGKQKAMSIGPYPVVSLADAREARDQAKRDLIAGVDPGQKKKDEKSGRKDVVTFRSVAEAYLAKLRAEGRSVSTLKKLTWLLDVANKSLGDRAPDEIDAAAVLDAVQPFEARGRHESARRMKSTIGSVFRYAMARAQASSDPTAALQGALARPVVTPRAAVTDPKALGALLRSIDGFDGQPVTHAALKLIAILFPRPGELRMAEWTDFDFDRNEWTIPAERMKMRRPHKIPLPTQAVGILKALYPISGGGRLVFPSLRAADRPISDGTLNAALRRLGYSKEEATAHGFRATASSLLNETGKWNPDAIERQLAHQENNDVRRAYARAEFWDERVKMMQWWADYLDGLKGGRD